MSGFEIAGVVLGGFPILLNCLEYYREGFEPLSDWWHFRVHFIAFVDDIRHQMMRYHESLIRLLDPVISDNQSLEALIKDPDDSRWKDGSIQVLLENRLSSELDRLLRILNRMQEIMNDLNKLLGINNGKISWIENVDEKPFQWHLKRLQISFSKGKQKKVKKLATLNQELQDILGYSERIIPISSRRKTSEPVKRLEAIRQHACSAYNILIKRWSCSQECRCHNAHLRLRSESDGLSVSVVFVWGYIDTPSLKHSLGPKACEVIIRKESMTHLADTANISEVQSSSALAQIQQNTEEKVEESNKKSNLLRKAFQKLQSKSEPTASKTNTPEQPLSSKKRVRFTHHIPSISVTPSSSSSLGNLASPDGDLGLGEQRTSSATQSRITDLCGFLDDLSHTSGVIHDENEKHLRFEKTPYGVTQIISNKIKLVPLPELLRNRNLSRQCRFNIAAHLAASLLHAHLSPWIPTSWSKHDFYFFVDADSEDLRSDHPFVSRQFYTAANETNVRVAEQILGSQMNTVSEDVARSCLSAVGVMILELIFGHNIEDCAFRKDFLNDGKPNDFTNINTARVWAKKVLGDSGPNVDDAVRRCLDCSFGPRPCFSDVRFRESVYEGVIKPLETYSSTWTDVMA